MMKNHQPSANGEFLCPECGRGQLRELTRTEEFDFDLGNEVVKVRAERVPVKQCDNCGQVLKGPAAAAAQHEAICRTVGLLTPSEIKALRERFGWSQQYLADLTDFGIATVSRWERGRLLQNRSANKVLLAIRDCGPFRDYLERMAGPRTKHSGPTEGTEAGPPEAEDKPNQSDWSASLPAEARVRATREPE